jgi:hydrogenase expression/formation protein HypC
VSLPLVPRQPESSGRTTSECRDEVCITCSDEAVEVTVVELLEGDLARVDTGEGIEEVSVMLVDARPGARILVHAKEAIAVVEP